MILSWLSEKRVTHSSHKRVQELKPTQKPTQRAAFLGYFDYVVDSLWTITKRHRLRLVKIANKLRQKTTVKDQLPLNKSKD